jgi:PAS domain S-box-containing protein
MGGAVVMGGAISSQHYLGMWAAHFVSAPNLHPDLSSAVGVPALGLSSVVLVAILVLVIAIATTSFEKRFAAQAQRLEESKSQLQAIFDSMADAIVLVDREHNIVNANHAAVQFLELPDRTVDVQHVINSFEVYAADGQRVSLEQLPSSRAFRGEFLKDCKLRVASKRTGKKVLVEISTSPILDAAGNLLQVMISYRDVTAREQMDEMQSRLAAIVESSEDAIVGKNEEGTVTAWNKAAERLFGYRAGEILGRSIRILLPEDREDEEDRILQRIKSGETIEHFETIRRRRDGGAVNVALTISPIKDASGRVIGASKIARDITHVKQIERQSRQSQKMEAIGQLTGGIAHDFNNLLGIIIGNLELLERIVHDNPNQSKRIATAKRAALRGANLTRRLLVFSRKEELRKSVTRLEETIRSIVELAERTIGPEIQITVHSDPSVPPIFVDSSLLENALLNIVVNARDAMPKGGSIVFSTREVHLDESYPAVVTGEIKSGRYACISVSDNGQGMSKEILERAFDPFFTTKPRDQGTGLGLATVYGFMRQSGGVARIYSELGHGTTVSLYIPTTPQQEQDEPKPSPQPRPAHRDRKILVVDDEPDLLEVAVAYLRELGYETVEARDSQSALDAFAKAAPIDLLITDVVMPGALNGVELAARVRELDPSVKIIYSSGFPADALTKKSGKLAFGPLINKPFQREEFHAAIRSALEGEENR